jgi:eukaryotic-like serine/threonine-protein kinase
MQHPDLETLRKLVAGELDDSAYLLIEPHIEACQDVCQRVMDLISMGIDFPGYRVERELGEGGMGTVYLATDLALNRPVAIKMMKLKSASDPSQVRRFREEALITGQLQHPGIPPVHALETTLEGRPYLVMKVIKGVTFAELLRKTEDEKPELSVLLGYFEQVCQAVAYAHEKGVIHRDLKPENIMIGAFNAVQVMDWGLAKVIQFKKAVLDTVAVVPESATVVITERDDDSNTRHGSIFGTFAYMPPEQARGQVDQVDKRSDVFGLGAILCTILTGKPPYIGVNHRAIELKAVEGNTDEAIQRIRNSGVDQELVALAQMSLACDVEARPADAGRLSMLLREYLQGVEERRRQAEISLAKAEAEAIEQRKRRRVQLALAVSIGMLFTGSGIFAWWESERLRERDLQSLLRKNEAEKQQQAIQFSIDQCEKSLRDDDTNLAKAALERVEALGEGINDESTRIRIMRCRNDLELLMQLNRINDLFWDTSEGEYLGKQAAIKQCATALKPYLGDSISNLDIQSAQKFVSESSVRERILAFLDLWLITEPSKSILLLLQALDPDPFRNRFREAIVAKNRDVIKALGTQEELTSQPTRFLSSLGYLELLSLSDRERILRVARNAKPDDFPTLMALGSLFRINQKDTASQRLQIYEAAISVRPKNPIAWLNYGLALADSGDSPAAMQAYNKVLQIDPSYKVAMNNLGHQLVTLGRYDEAIEQLQKAISKDPKYSLPYHNLGWAFEQKKDYANSIKAYQTAIMLGGDQKKLNQSLTRVVWENGDKAKSVEVYRDILKTEPKNAYLHNRLACSLEHLGDFESAISEYMEAIRLDPSLGYHSCNFGHVQFEKKNPAGDLKVCEEAVAKNPNNAYLLVRLGVARERVNDPKGAEESYREAINLNSDGDIAHSNLAALLSDQGKSAEAIEFHRRAIQLQPKIAKLHIRLGDSLWLLKDYEGSIQCIRDAIELDPTNAYHYQTLGNALNSRKLYDGATQAYQEAIRLEPNVARHHFNLGTALVGKSDSSRAIPAFREAIRLYPEYWQAYNALGDALRTNRDYKNAVAAYRKAIAIKPKNRLSYTNLGYSLLYDKEVQDIEGAVKAYREASRVDPTSAYAKKMLGTALEKQGKLAEAILNYQDAVRLDHLTVYYAIDLSKALIKNGNSIEALSALKLAITVNPSNPLLQTTLGDQLYEQKKYPEAVTAYQIAIKLDSKSSSHYFNLGKALKAAGDIEGAKKIYLEGSRSDQIAFTIALFGNELAELDDLENAIRAYQRAIRIQRLYIFYLPYGKALARIGNRSEAIKVFREGSRLANANYWRLMFGTALQEIGDFEGAIFELKKVVDSESKAADIHGKLGEVNQQIGQLSESIKEYQAAIQLDAKEPRYHAGLGVSYKLNHEREKAIHHLKQAIEMKTSDPLAYQELARIQLENHQPDKALEVLRSGIVINPKLIEDVVYLFHLISTATRILEESNKAGVNQNGMELEIQGWLKRLLSKYETIVGNKIDQLQAYRSLDLLLHDPQFNVLRSLEVTSATDRNFWAKFWSGCRKLHTKFTPESLPIPRELK